ncbi:MAG: hypothetical protein EPN17_17435 [Methylobacter sp.]|nr:MAG: hypothetical protein EPN17_17435 [Methylobacter sp.]
MDVILEHDILGSSFKVQGSRFKVQGSRFKVQGSRFKVKGSDFKLKALFYLEPHLYPLPVSYSGLSR